MDRRRAERGVGPVARASRARFANSATRSGSLRGRSPGTRGSSVPLATSTPVAGIASSASATLRRVEAAGERDRDLARDRGGERDVHPHPGAARVGAAGGVEQDPRGTGVEERAGGRDVTRVGAAVPAATRRALDVGRPVCGDRGRRLVAVELDRVGVDGGDDLGQPVGGRSAVTSDDLGARVAGCRAPGEGRERGRLLERRARGASPARS